MRSTGRTSGCGCGVSSTVCPTCWPPAPPTRWPPSTGGSASPRPDRRASHRGLDSAVGRRWGAWPAPVGLGGLSCWPDSTPMAAEYDATDVHGLLQLAVLVDDFWHAESPRDRQTASAEMRLQGVRFGLSPIDRRRLQWKSRAAR